MPTTAIAEVQSVSLERLHAAPWNPRTIKDERFQNLCQSIQADPDFLWRRPVLAQADGAIYTDNMRWRPRRHPAPARATRTMPATRAMLLPPSPLPPLPVFGGPGAAGRRAAGAASAAFGSASTAQAIRAPELPVGSVAWSSADAWTTRALPSASKIDVGPPVNEMRSVVVL